MIDKFMNLMKPMFAFIEGLSMPNFIAGMVIFFIAIAVATIYLGPVVVTVTLGFLSVISVLYMLVAAYRVHKDIKAETG